MNRNLVTSCEGNVIVVLYMDGYRYWHCGAWSWRSRIQAGWIEKGRILKWAWSWLGRNLKLGKGIITSLVTEKGSWNYGRKDNFVTKNGCWFLRAGKTRTQLIERTSRKIMAARDARLENFLPVLYSRKPVDNRWWFVVVVSASALFFATRKTGKRAQKNSTLTNSINLFPILPLQWERKLFRGNQRVTIFLYYPYWPGANLIQSICKVLRKRDGPIQQKRKEKKTSEDVRK